MLPPEASGHAKRAENGARGRLFHRHGAHALTYCWQRRYYSTVRARGQACGSPLVLILRKHMADATSTTALERVMN
jgi:hypothetical protein